MTRNELKERTYHQLILEGFPFEGMTADEIDKVISIELETTIGQFRSLKWQWEEMIQAASDSMTAIFTLLGRK